MTLDELFEQVEQNKELRGMGIEETDKGAMLLIEHVPSHLTTKLPAAAVEKLDWPLLLSVLIGEREPKVLERMTRVCGYFSRLDNFNRSKIGEIKDRIKGQYAVEGTGRTKQAISTAAAVLGQI